MLRLFIAGLISMTLCSCTSVLPKKAYFHELVIFKSGEENIREFRIPSLVTTNKGTLIAICDGRVKRSGDLPNNIDLVCKRSTDGGRTWSPLVRILDYDGWEGACDPCTVVDRNTGRIWVFSLHGKKGVGLWQSKAGIEEDYTGHILAVYSDDDGKTWSEPVNLNSQVKNPKWLCALAAPGRGFQMKNGTLVIPGYYRPSQQSRKLCSYLFYSKDHGKTWQYRTTPAENTTECTVVELEDGRLMLNMRNHYRKGCRAVSYTSDMGKTWTPLVFDQQLPEPVCQGSMIKAEIDGKKVLIFSNPHSKRGRKNMTVKVSFDDGKTWPVSKVIFPGLAAYSCLTKLPNGNIGLLYEKGGYGNLTFCSFPFSYLTKKDKPKKIIVFGESTTAFRKGKVKKVYSVRLEEALRNIGLYVVVLNEGVGGSHTGSIKDNAHHRKQHARDRFEQRVLQQQPNVVIMQYGINDSYVDKVGPERKSRISLEKYYQNLDFMVKKMKDAGIKVVLMTPNQFDDRKEQWRLERLEKYAEKMRKLASENKVPLVDAWKMYEEYGKSKKSLLLDGVHPNDEGHRLLADKLVPVVEKILK